ncbi:hypothetical protein ACTFIV_003181 [Dictyostelium citrinum]
MFIINDEHEVYTGTIETGIRYYAIVDKLIANSSSQAAEADGLEIIGNYPDNEGHHYYPSIGWSPKLTPTGPSEGDSYSRDTIKAAITVTVNRNMVTFVFHNAGCSINSS